MVVLESPFHGFLIPHLISEEVCVQIRFLVFGARIPDSENLDQLEKLDWNPHELTYDYISSTLRVFPSPELSQNTDLWHLSRDHFSQESHPNFTGNLS